MLCLLFVAVGLLLAGCDSPSRRERAEASSDAPRPIAMRGETKFFDGKLRAEATVSRGRTVPFGDKDGDAAGGGGGKHGGGHGHRHGGGDADYSPSSSPTEDEDGDQPVRRIQVGGAAPAVTLRLKLENTSKEPLDVQIRDVKSDLGDFAVRPEHLLLAPDQSAEVDPMISELGVTSDEIPVTLVLSIGGKTEKQDVVVKNLFTPK